jgi:hypothetical protein
MSLAERLYRMVLWLYPADHRQAYEEPMVQLARDLSRTARSQSQLQVFWLGLRLFKDGILNAGIEHLEMMKMANTRFTPASWLSVLLAAFPGLLIALTRRTIVPLAPLLNILGYLYLGILLLLPPIIWWRRRRFPVWVLLPAGLIVWLLTYLAGPLLARGINFLINPRFMWIHMETVAAVLNALLAGGLFVALLPKRRMPVSFWLIISLILLFNLIMAVFYSLDRYNERILLTGMITYFTGSGIGPIEGLLFVAAGLLAVRQHGVLAILVVIGGYSYMCGDSDYLWGSAIRDWPFLALYLAAVTFLYLVVVPVALLRARTRLGRVVAVFVPVVIFHLARLILPGLVNQAKFVMPLGDSVHSLNILLSLALAWVLYSEIDKASQAVEAEDRISVDSLPA